MKKSYKLLVALVCTILVFSTASLFLWSGILSYKISSDDEAFRILQLTDVHIRNDKRDSRVFTTIDKLIKKAQPDLIVVTGDISSNVDNESDFKKFSEFIEQYKIEWTFTFGNHDSEGNWKKSEISQYLQSLQYCSYQDGFVVEEKENDIYTQGSYGNYFKNILNEKNETIMSLFMLDSNMYINDTENNIDGYANFRDEQIAWYETSVKQIAQDVNGDQNKVLPSLAFFHIPMEEQNSGKKINGNKFEKVCCSPASDKMFEKMVELGSTRGCFFGHDHMNSFTTQNAGIKLSYGYSADHTIYFVPQKGGTIISIKNDGSFSIQGIYRNFGIGNVRITKAF